VAGRALKRILLVEDDPDIQSVAALALQSLGGFTVEVCGSATQCLEAAARFAPDLILLDMMLPEMDGADAFAALRRVPQTAHTPVVFLTAEAHRASRAQPPHLRPIGVIAKPFEPTLLAEKVRRLWEERADPLDR
jgi:CheY-like chemotaxis protein